MVEWEAWLDDEMEYLKENNLREELSEDDLYEIMRDDNSDKADEILEKAIKEIMKLPYFNGNKRKVINHIFTYANYKLKYEL